jgi:hypothetical protein
MTHFGLRFGTLSCDTLEALEEERQHIARRLQGWRMASLLGVGGLLLWVIGQWGFHPALLQALIAAGVVWASIDRSLARWLTQGYRLSFKATVLGPWLQTHFPGLRYDPTVGIVQSDFENAQWTTDTPDRYTSEDYFMGTLADCAVELSEVHSQVHRGSGRNRRLVTQFHGLMAVITLPHYQPYEMVIVPETGAPLLLQQLSRWNARLNQRVMMDDPVFEGHYAVFCNDAVIAHQVLTHRIMAHLVAFRQATEVPVYVTILMNKIYVGVAHGHALFEPPLHTPVNRLQVLEEMKGDLQLVANLIEDWQSAQSSPLKALKP